MRRFWCRNLWDTYDYLSRDSQQPTSEALDPNTGKDEADVGLIGLYPNTWLNGHIRWPSWLDNSVAGGIPSGMPVFESLVKECEEEASMEGDFVRNHAKPVGTISYFFRYQSARHKLGLNCKV